MQAPMKARDLAEAKAKRRAETARHTVGLVWPDGRVTTHVCEPPGEGEDEGIRTGDTPVRWTNGEPNVWKPYRDRGCRLLKDVCEADGVPERYDAWHQVITAQITKPGIAVRGDVEDIYPPSVLKLRASAAVGGLSDGMAFVIGKGIAPDPEIKSKKLLDQLASAGLKLPSQQEIDAAAKGAGSKQPKPEKAQSQSPENGP